MRSRHCLAWGSVAALLSAAALAQQPESSQPRRDSATQPGRTTTTQPATSTGRMSGLRSSDPKMILNDMDGVWRVEMRINPETMKHMNMDRGLGHDMNDGVRHDPSRPAPAATQPGNANRPAGTQPTTPNNNNLNNDRNQPNNPNNNPNRTADIDVAGGTLVEGYCEKRWILGGDILQETCVIPDIGAAMTGGLNADQPGNAARPATDPDRDGQPSLENLEAGRMFQNICFLSFNEESDSFDYVQMNTMKDGICHATGTFDASTGVIELNVTDVMGGGAHGANRHMDPNYRDSTREPGMIDDPNARNQPGRPINPGTTGTNTGNQPRTTTPASPSTTNPAAVTPGSPQTNQPRTTTPGATNPDRPAQPDRVQPDRGVDDTRMYNMRNDAGENFKVVVEILSPDQHRITMYQDDAGATGMSTPTSVTPSRTTTTTTTPPRTTTTTTPGQTDPDRPAEGTPGFQPRPSPDQPTPPGAETPGSTGTTGNQPGTTTTTTQPRTTTTTTMTQPGTALAGHSGFKTAYGTMIWQATYTRADGAEASRYRQFLERADQLMQASVADDEGDR